MFSGGRAPEYIRYDEDLVRITKHFFDTNKPVASVCHGVEIPAYADCVRGRRMATVPKCKFDLEVCGGTFVDEPCVVDGNLVSGRTFHDNGHYVGPWIAMLEKAAVRDRRQLTGTEKSAGAGDVAGDLRRSPLAKIDAEYSGNPSASGPRHPTIASCLMSSTLPVIDAGLPTGSLSHSPSALVATRVRSFATR